MMLMRWKVDIMRTIIGGLLATSLGVKPLFPRCAQETEKKKKNGVLGAVLAHQDPHGGMLSESRLNGRLIG